ncbi:hypothetical protein FHR24_000512 [Wenyingzhuangia heitensis]|uniref:SusD family protein n=1 Tax=Wenyingzhuangia heitensis TaxID=1487859 RepID=A0ABX0U7C0_9FLAO|nr:RagB/SusD family nutrient uptake outer membrane protein [Wenyingzhuangia heitensis]NIJ44073.1 hypothetical protein [Wenyingzhuangia heitensis]
MKSYFLALCLIVVITLSCTKEELNTKIDETETEVKLLVLSGTDFFIEKTIDHTYLFSVVRANDTLLLETNDTLQGDYKIVSFNTVVNQKSAVIQYTLSNKTYSSKSGLITIQKDSIHKISAKLNAVIIANNNTQDSLLLDSITLEDVLVYSNTSLSDMEDEDIEALLTEIYTKELPIFLQYQFLFDSFYTNQITEKPFGSKTDLNSHTVKSTNIDLDKFWQSIYSTIHWANRLAEVSALTYKDHPNKLNSKLAEAYALRAYAYSAIINWFGNGPMLLKTITNIPELEYKNTNEITAQITKDLEFSIQYLPSNFTKSENRITTDFAKVLLSRIYFMQNEYQKTIDILETIVSENKYSLSNSVKTPKTSELLYSYGFNFSSSNTNSAIINSLNNNYNLSIQSLNISRYSEVLLMLSECYNQTNNVTKAIEYLDKLRTRSQQPIISPTISKSELSKTIFKQYQNELQLDGNRFYILKAFNKAIDELNIENYQLILPIPKSEIELNVNAKQNIGY